ncbi:TonB-dependent receptor [Mucilaginibacter sp. FT3.2]|uniref:TonB-dependent receptor n=1 Tax=Mucilaginibacter sp. FT3.2 TaxID=2723090 RepID=UPI001607BBDD|nr:TonB-dependent receptor [Mucilaginibacter sp. FT3.2]MBB6231645.1 iron complex outermembrane receptor protein [Mucilaginibacter sp. FT3.2]
MKKIILLLIFFSLAYGQNIFAQKRTVSGIVTAADDKAPLPGVSIRIKGLNEGAVTKADGTFSIVVRNGKYLVFSFLGYESQEVEIDGHKEFNVVLKPAGNDLNEVQIVGSRNANRTKLNSASAVDVIDIKPLLESAPQTSVTQLLQYISPSFHSVNGSNAGDAGSALSLAQLRGLGPDQVLVLVNGKRRHKSANVNYGGLGNGSTGYDLNSIPAGSIDRIEILRDGAAAQYGSDAIAGVINIVLKKKTDDLSVNTSGSTRRRGDGATTRTSVNYGVGLGNTGGYINATAEYATQAIALPAGRADAGLYNGPIYGGGANTRGYDAIYTKAIDDAILASRGINRHFFDQRGGGANPGQDALLSFNAGFPLNKTTDIYAFGGISSRNSQFTAVYRLPGWTSRNNNFIYPDGFLPDMENNIVDGSIAVGIKGKVGDWNVDLSNVFGKNSFSNRVDNSLNASLGLKSPTSFDAGRYNAGQNTTGLDFSRYFEKVLKGLNVAFGAQHRIESFQIIAGEEGSYSKADQRTIVDVDTTTGGIPYLSNAGVTSLNGLAAGSQIHLGFRPENAVNVSRSITAGYADVELNVTKAWLISGAGRAEYFSDFGNVFTWKAATRYSFARWLNIRGSANTGFRAPDLAQSYYTSISTTFQQGKGVDILTASNQSAAARALGIPKLTPEKSKGYALGLTSAPGSNIELTVDAYLIDIDNRVGNTGNFTSTDVNLPADVKTLFQQTGAAQANFFYNEFSTRTKGVEFTGSYKVLLDKGNLNFLFGGNFSKNEVTKVNTPKGLEAYKNVILSPGERARVTTNIPAQKINLQGIYSVDKFTFLLRTVYFGKVTTASLVSAADPLNPVYFYQNLKPIWVTDLSVGYRFTAKLQATAGVNNVFNILGDYTDPSIAGLRNPTVVGIQNGSAGIQPFIKLSAHL